ncbi:glycosyltransferase involved in cell wall biosynthesis [Desulfitobacterium sp. LBE]|uniref:glycosyltransferase n=1 Tax=Desulfitobacterium sp. LBE TaxID=884086 RepID=UPI00119957E1|nr:glycosyltransferase [Desulfitobacterium sp. LBE]TWH59722.1 glycosyltransferase involved in cell wall biosynthesis [Desulfitobacterium sp. LBE]
MGFNFSLEPGKVLRKRYGEIKEKPLVSVITAYYNAGKYFEQTFNSVLNQTFPYFEWIIVNDGSTNEADVRLLESLAQRDSRIKVLRKENGGAAAARNLGIKVSETDIIVFLDADDLIDKRYIEYTYFVLQQNSGVTWAYTDSLGFEEQEYLWQKEFSSEAMKKENILPYVSAIRKDIFLEEELYDDNSKNMWEDYQLWLKLLAKGHYPAHIEQVMFWYRRLNSGALAKIEKDEQLKESLKMRIQSLVRDVPDGIRAVTFGGKRTKEFARPHKWEWDRILPFAEEKTRILMLLPHMECGGADKFNLDIIKNINKEKYEIGIITTVPAESEWRQQFAQYADDIFELPSFLDMNDWSAFIHYYIKSRNVKILWNISSYYGYYTLPWLRAQFSELAIIDCVHAEGQYWRAGGYPRVSAAVDGVLEKTFVTNEFTRNIMIERYGKDRSKTQVIYTGVDETELDPDKVDCSGIKKQWGIEEKRPVVLYLCRIAPEKRPFLMLEVAKEVKKRNKDICFLVVGSGPQSEELQQKVKLEGLENTVYILGKQADIKSYYKICDLFLLTSIKEGLSITTLESMVMGKPVVSADVGSQYELVNDKTGRLIPCRQDEARDFDSRSFSKEEITDYVDAIDELLSNKIELVKMGKACREKILAGYTLNCLMETLDKEFTDLLQPDAMEKRARIAEALKLLDGVCEEFMTMYIEYESVQLDFRSAYKFMRYFRELVTFKRSIFSVMRELTAKKGSPILKRLIRELRSQ